MSITVRYGIYHQQVELNNLPSVLAGDLLDYKRGTWGIPADHALYESGRQLASGEILSDGVTYEVHRAGRGSMVPPAAQDTTELKQRILELERHNMSLRMQLDAYEGAERLEAERRRIADSKEFFS